MGALIQTKGTQRLAKLFNQRFNETNLPTARSLAAGSGTLKDAFDNASNDLIKISKQFIAQNAVSATWVPDLEDLLYPSVTLKVAFIPAGTTNQLTFTIPTGFSPASVKIAAGWTAFSLDKRKSIKRDTTVSMAPLTGTSLAVTFNKDVGAAIGERISFARGPHQRLVRRWEWYLQHDLLPDNHQAIRRAISTALGDEDFKSISFHTVEETQRVIVSARQALKGANDDLDDLTEMQILLMTQATTAPDKLDEQ